MDNAYFWSTLERQAFLGASQQLCSVAQLVVCSLPMILGLAKQLRRKLQSDFKEGILLVGKAKGTVRKKLLVEVSSPDAHHIAPN